MKFGVRIWQSALMAICLAAVAGCSDNSPEGQYKLGCRYKNESDPQKAVECFRKSAEVGYGPAAYELGLCYFNGVGVEKDQKKATTWYRKAADNGHNEAAFELGKCFENGIGVTKDTDRAIEWYRKGGEKGKVAAERLKKMREEIDKMVQRDLKRYKEREAKSK